MRAVLRLNTSVEALAALGAELHLCHKGADGDPRVRAKLQRVDVNQVSAVLGGIQSLFRQDYPGQDRPV